MLLAVDISLFRSQLCHLAAQAAMKEVAKRVADWTSRHWMTLSAEKLSNLHEAQW